MKHNQTNSNRRGRLAVTTAAIISATVLGLSSSVFAGNTWDGGGGDDLFGTGNNWNPDGAPSPGTGNDLFFAGGTRLTPNNNYTAFDDWRNWIFNSGAGSFTISGNSVDFFGKIENNSANLQTVSITSFSMNSSTGSELDPTLGDLTITSANIFGNGNEIHVYGNNAKTLRVTGNIQGAGTKLTLETGNTVILSGVSTYTGDTFLRAGTLRFSANNAIASDFIRLGDTSGTGGANLNLDGGLGLSTKINVRSGSSGTKTIANTVSTSGTATYSGNLFLDHDVTLFANSGGSVTLSGGTLDLKNQTLTVDGPGSSTISGVLQQSTGSGKLIKNGAGTLSLNGANTFTGGATLNTGGTLNISNAMALGTGTFTIGGNSTFDNSTASTLAIANALTLSASPTFTGSSDLTINGATTISGANRTITVNANTLTLGGAVGDAGGGRKLTKDGSGSLVLTNSNTYTGGTTVSVGTLGIGNNGAIGTGTLTLGNGTTTAFGGARTVTNTISITATTAATIGGTNVLTLSGTVTDSAGGRTLTINNTASTTLSGNVFISDDNTTGGRTLTVNGTGNAAINGVIANNNAGNTVAAALTYSGSGTLTLGNANTYSGATTISSGTVLLNGSIASGSSTTNLSGATLGGSGTVNGPLGIGSGGVLAPGTGAASAGTTLTLAGTVTLNASCIVSNRIKKAAGPIYSADKVNKSGGTLTLAGTLKVVLDSGSTALALGDTFDLFDGTLAGGFTTLVLPTLPTGLAWSTAQLGTGGNGTIQVVCDGSLTATAGAVTSPICSGSTLALTGSASNGSGGYSYGWTGPNGFSSSSQNPTIPNATTAASGTYTLTVTDSVGCTAVSQVIITVNPAATASAGGNQTVCSSSPAVTLAGSVGGGATGGTWSGGAGTFNPNSTTLNATYTPSAGEITAGTVTLTLTSSGQSSPCGAATSQMTITINATPSAPPTTGDTRCGSGTVNLSASGGGGTLSWYSDAGLTTLVNTGASYSPSLSSTTTYYVTETSGSGCVSSASTVIGAINTVATVNAGPDQTVPASTATVTLAGSVGGGASGGQWTTTGTGTFDDATLPGAIYTPSVADKTTARYVTNTLTTTGANQCAAVNDAMIITFNSAPVPANTNYTRTKGQQLKVKISDLLALASDADTDTVIFQGVNSGTNGATVTTNATYIFYSPTTGATSNANDLLVYTLRDNFGGSASANLQINVSYSVGAVSITNNTGSSMTLSLYGIPGNVYIFQRSPDLSAWTDISTNTAPDANNPPAGLMQYTETPPYNPAYYRARTP